MATSIWGNQEPSVLCCHCLKAPPCRRPDQRTQVPAAVGAKAQRAAGQLEALRLVKVLPRRKPNRPSGQAIKLALRNSAELKLELERSLFLQNNGGKAVVAGLANQVLEPMAAEGLLQQAAGVPKTSFEVAPHAHFGRLVLLTSAPIPLLRSRLI